MAENSVLQDHAYLLDRLMEVAYDGIVVVDDAGIIRHISTAYLDFLQIPAEEALGRHVAEVVENTRMHLVLETGQAEVAQLQMIKGDYMVASRFPLYRNGKLVGAIGKVLFRNIDELQELNKHIRLLQRELEQCRVAMRSGAVSRHSFDEILGESPPLLLAKEHARKAAATDSTVLLLGESGCGKELFAQAVHRESPRSAAPFIKINCAAIPAELLESELFGYEDGAFTGARKGGKIGKFEAANGGTVFLDEIGDMPLQMQAKLLRVLQDREVEPIGATVGKRVDVRILAATNRDLTALVDTGRFRSDLYYRLSVVEVRIPPLRERRGDLDLLIPHLLQQACARLGKYVEEIAPDAMARLRRYDWPGNVRQLQNVIEHAVVLVDRDAVIRPEQLPRQLRTEQEIAASALPTLEDTLATAEAAAIQQALRAAKGKKAQAARLLGISRSKLYERMARLGFPS